MAKKLRYKRPMTGDLGWVNSLHGAQTLLLRLERFAKLEKKKKAIALFCVDIASHPCFSVFLKQKTSKLLTFWVSKHKKLFKLGRKNNKMKTKILFLKFNYCCSDNLSFFFQTKHIYSLSEKLKKKKKTFFFSNTKKEKLKYHIHQSLFVLWNKKTLSFAGVFPFHLKKLLPLDKNKQQHQKKKCYSNKFLSLSFA